MEPHRSVRARGHLISALAVTVAVLSIAGCRANTSGRGASALRIHIAHVDKTPGTMPQNLPDERETIYVEPDAILSGRDVTDVRVVKVRRVLVSAIVDLKGNVLYQGTPGTTVDSAVALTLTRSGARRLARAVNDLKGRSFIGQVMIGNERRLATPVAGKALMPNLAIGRLAFLVDDKLVVAPAFKGEIVPRMLIDGHFTREEAGRLVAHLKTCPASPSADPAPSKDEPASPPPSPQ